MKDKIISLGRYLPSRIKRQMIGFGVQMMHMDEQDQFRKDYQIPNVERSLRNMKRAGFAPQRIVDVGAYVGDWARMTRGVFPASEIHMVEAQPSNEEHLKAVHGTTYDITLLGAEEKDSVEFFVLETGSSVLPEQSSINRDVQTYRMQTLDSILAQRAWNRVDLLKIDVQGYELEVMKGAEQTLMNTEAVLMEVSLIPINLGAPLVHDVIAFMRERRFRLYDVCTLIRRPLDDALWQIDAVFVHDTSPLVAQVSFD